MSEENIIAPERLIVNRIFDNLDGLIDASILSDANQNFVSNHLSINLIATRQIEIPTVEQSNCPSWFEERRKRLTASNFGSILNRRKDFYSSSLLKKLFSKE